MSSKSEGLILFYQTGGSVSTRVRLKNETFWFTRKVMAEPFDVQIFTIAKHLKNRYYDDWLNHGATSSKIEIAQNEGCCEITRSVDFYNPDTVIAVGYD
jgi:hypothetical protein